MDTVPLTTKPPNQMPSFACPLRERHRLWLQVNRASLTMINFDTFSVFPTRIPHIRTYHDLLKPTKGQPVPHNRSSLRLLNPHETSLVSGNIPAFCTSLALSPAQNRLLDQIGFLDSPSPGVHRDVLSPTEAPCQTRAELYRNPPSEHTADPIGSATLHYGDYSG